MTMASRFRNQRREVTTLEGMWLTVGSSATLLSGSPADASIGYYSPMLTNIRSATVRRWRAISGAVSWPPVSASALRAAESLAALHALIVDRPLDGFNGQIVRAKYLMAIFEATGCTGFLETGTYHGGTTLTARELFATDVYTAEVNRTYMLQAKARVRLARLDRIHFLLGDSRMALGKWLDCEVAGCQPMIYLDAHWGSDFPLAAELVIAGCQGRCLIVIDDFRVPGDDGFGFDTYHGVPIDLGFIAPHLPRDAWGYIPAHLSSQETGGRRGTLIVGIGIVEPTLGDFPRSLLKKIPLDP